MVSETSRPSVSVVVPCLNRAHFLVPTIESVLNQDYPNIECIVVDGGSTDGTIEILRRYGDRIKWVSEPDRGHADAINKGWRMSKGEILAWLNADDVWEVPGAASRAVAFLEAHPETDVVYGDCGALDAEGNVIGMSYLHEWDLAYAVERCDHCIPQPSAFIRRSILERAGWLDTDFYQKKDHELWLRIGLVGNIRHLPVVLAHARDVPGLSFDGRTVAPACVQVTRKFFSLPGVPDNIKKKRRRAMSNAYLRGTDYAWAGGRLWPIIIKYTAQAVLADPTNAPRAVSRLRLYVGRGLREYGSHPLVANVLAFMAGTKRVVAKLRNLRASFRPPRAVNLLGDRDIEWSWVAAHMPEGPGEALDFGCASGYLSLIAAQRRFRVTAVDMEQMDWPHEHPNIRFVLGDILKLPLPKSHFDLVVNCSTVEHVGLVGRYGVTEERPDGDLEAMAHLRDLMKPGAVMLLTVPVGRDAVFHPMCRVYGAQRLPRLLDGYAVLKKEFWAKDGQNRWIQCDEREALAFEASAGSWDPLQNAYGLGCFLLRAATDEDDNLVKKHLIYENR